MFLVGTRSPVKRLHLPDAIANGDGVDQAEAADNEDLPFVERAGIL